MITQANKYMFRKFRISHHIKWIVKLAKGEVAPKIPKYRLESHEGHGIAFVVSGVSVGMSI